MKTLKNLKHSILALCAISTFTFTSCDNDDEVAPEEHDHEVITHVELIFTPEGGGDAVTAHAEDPDGEGVEDLEVDGPIDLAANTTYTLTFEILNELHDEHDDERDDERHDEERARNRIGRVVLDSE